MNIPNVQTLKQKFEKRDHLSEYDVPAPTDGHVWEVSEGSVEPKWNSTDILPQSIVDLLSEELG